MGVIAMQIKPIQAVYLEREYDDKNKSIVSYILKDKKGSIRRFSAKDLKEHIKAGKIEVENLTLTSDNRLVKKKIQAKVQKPVPIKNAQSNTPRIEEVEPDKKEITAKSFKTVAYTRQHTKMIYEFMKKMNPSVVDLLDFIADKSLYNSLIGCKNTVVLDENLVYSVFMRDNKLVGAVVTDLDIIRVDNWNFLFSSYDVENDLKNTSDNFKELLETCMHKEYLYKIGESYGTPFFKEVNLLNIFTKSTSMNCTFVGCTALEKMPFIPESIKQTVCLFDDYDKIDGIEMLSSWVEDNVK